MSLVFSVARVCMNPSQSWMLNAYQVTEQLYEGSRTLVYRGRRGDDQTPVILKMLRSDYPNLSELAQFRNQSTIAQTLDIPGVIKTHGVETYQNREVLVMEDFGGISLEQAIERWRSQAPEQVGVGLLRFFQIATQIVTALEGLSWHRVIHKDIKPANLLINLHTQQVKLIDFSIASCLDLTIASPSAVHELEGTLAYLSPEQTGRTNCGIDYRTDFYALGVTFFELLSGQLPFRCEDPMKLLHCHLAVHPSTVTSLNAEVPQVLSEVVAKLMAKNAEERYQSAVGIRHDLMRCQQQWEQTGTIQPFELGQQDRSDRFVVSEKLYGREEDIATILAAFDRISELNPELNNTRQRSELVLVTGHSGVGKTAVIQEIYQPVLRQNGYFIKGKFDQFNHNIPFSALVQALRDLMGQLLGQGTAQLERWKLKILRELGDSAAVILEVIPELIHVIGVQPPAIELSGSAAQNRFNLLIQKFIQIFAANDHPLVIFLDDLQWADLATLRLMQLLTSESSHGLLFIGSYRDNEVTIAHPLIQILAEIQESGTPITSIVLTPLSLEDINHLVADSLHIPDDAARSLSQFIHRVTQGNPFFSRQLLKSCHEEGWISADRSTQSWTFDLECIQSQVLTEDVVEFMGIKLQKLSKPTQHALIFAACIGNQFELATLAIVCQKSCHEIAIDLNPAVQEGLLILKSDRSENQNLRTPIYQFLHDRVQQAAYILIQNDQKNQVHLKIGQLLLVHTSEADREEKIFSIVNQLNFASDLIRNPVEREQLAQLNLVAGRKAIAATAYPSAMEYLTEGIYLLSDDCWEHQYRLALELYELATESAAISGAFKAMENWTETLLDHAKSDLDRVRTYEIKIQSYSSQNRLLEAISIARIALKPLGFDFPMDASSSDITAAFQATAEQLGDRSIDTLANLPQMDDIDKLSVMRIVMGVMPAVFLAIPSLYPLLILSQVNASIQYGNAPLSALAYACYGMLLNAVLRETDVASNFSDLAIQLTSRSTDKDLTARTYFVVGAFLAHNKRHIREIGPLLLEGYQLSLETGNIEYVGYYLQHLAHNNYLMGQDLASLEKETQSYIEVLSNFKQITNLNYCKIFRDATLQLLDPNEKARKLDKAYVESESYALLLKANDVTGLHLFHLHRLIISYLFEDFDQARENALQARQYLPGSTGFFSTSVYFLYDSLSALARYSIENSAETLQQVAENQVELKHWAHHAPMNHLHKFYLVEAERHRVLGDRAEAIEYYDLAIAAAQENHYLNEEALACELAGRFYLAWGKPTIAQSYFTDAYYKYGRWGAVAKVKDLENRYPQLLMPLAKTANSPVHRSDVNPFGLSRACLKSEPTHHHNASNQVSHQVSHQFDLETIVKSLQALSSEIQLEKLLTVLMQAMLTHAGAQKCILLLLNDEKWLMSSHSTLAEPLVLQPMPMEIQNQLPHSVIHYVTQTTETLVMDDARVEINFRTDPYIIIQQPKSLLCTPILHQGTLIGILYLENTLTANVFTYDRLKILNLLTSQAAISLQNAELYNTLEQKVHQRTQELNVKNQDLLNLLAELQQTQSQLIQTEKMSSIGQMVAGVAHEINNPVNFIYGNLKYTSEYAENLLDLIRVYESCYPNALPEVRSKMEEIELEFVRNDLPQMLKSMEMGAERIRTIVLSLRNFSRLDESDIKPVDIHEGIDSTLLILQHRLTSDTQSSIQIVKQYGQIPRVACFARQLNQVFLNILNNAIDSLSLRSDFEISPIITIQTELIQNFSVKIRISDNGSGISEPIMKKIFDPFFTTKPIGTGTGLGLFISYQIVVQKHQGSLTCHSVPGQGTEFTIEIPL